MVKMNKFLVEVFDNKEFKSKVFEIEGTDKFFAVGLVARKIDLAKEEILAVKEVKEK